MKKIIIITLLLAVIGSIAGMIYGVSFDKPEFTSTSRLMVRNPKTANQARDYASIATSTSVLNHAKDYIGRDIELSVLGNYISATNLSGTNMINIAVSTPDARLSNDINRAVIKGLKEQVAILYQEEDGIIEVDPASTAQQTRSPNPLLSATLGGIAGIFVGLTASLLFYPQPEKNEAMVQENQDGADMQAEIASSASQITDSGAEKANDKQAIRQPPRSSGDIVTDKSRMRRAQHSKVQMDHDTEEDKELDEILESLEKRMKKR